MKALIIAGGFGTRLRPLTCTQPKHLFPVGGKPLVDWTLERLAKCGIQEVVFALNYMREAFFERYKESAFGMRINYSYETSPLGTGGCIKKAQALCDNEAFLVLNGDILSDIDYERLVAQHKKNGEVATLALRRVDDPSRYGAVEITKANRIKRFIEKPERGKAPSSLINAGVYAMNPEIFDCIQPRELVSLERKVFPVLAEADRLFGFEVEGLWVDIGEPGDYLKANRLIMEKEVKDSQIAKTVKIKRNVRILNPVVIGEGTVISDKATIGPYVSMGNNANIKKGAFIENSIIFSDAVISDFARLQGALVGKGAFLGNRVKIGENCIIGDYAVIHDDVTLTKGVTVCPQKEVTRSVLTPKTNNITDEFSALL